MRLTRRDAIAALAATGATVSGGTATYLGQDVDDGPSAIAATQVDTLVATATVLYPSAVENVGQFVRRYVRGRAENRPSHVRGMADAVDYLDAYADAWYGDPFAVLDGPTKEGALRRMKADTADPDPEGTDVERVRYYVVNELLFALYATPTGSELVGLDNPQGYPGGLASYQRGPPA